MAVLVHPGSELIREPRLLVPQMQPVGRVRVDWTHPIVKSASHVFTMFDGRSLPVNLRTGASMDIDASDGAGSFGSAVVAGKRCIARADMDYVGNALRTTDLTRSVTTPLFIFLSFAVLLAPSGASQAVFQIGNSIRDGTPNIILNSASTTNLKVYWGGGDRKTNIPVSVGQWQRWAFLYDGGTSWVSLHSTVAATAGSNQGTGQSAQHWLGTGWSSQLPCAFDLFIAGNVSLPRNVAEDWILDPYQFLIPA